MEAAGRLLDQDELELKRGPVEARRIDGTVLITDIVGSTEHAARLGDVAWDRLLAEHDAAVNAEIDHHHGTRIKMTGDGVLALFESAVDACRCALGIRGRVRGLGLEVRAGVHTGSFLISGDDLHGLGLHIAARVMASAIDGGVPSPPKPSPRWVRSYPTRRTDDPDGIPGVGSLRARLPRDSLELPARNGTRQRGAPAVPRRRRKMPPRLQRQQQQRRGETDRFGAGDQAYARGGHPQVGRGDAVTAVLLQPSF